MKNSVVRLAVIAAMALVMPACATHSSKSKCPFASKKCDQTQMKACPKGDGHCCAAKKGA